MDYVLVMKLAKPKANLREEINGQVLRNVFLLFSDFLEVTLEVA